MCTRVHYLCKELIRMVGSRYLRVFESSDQKQKIWVFGEVHKLYKPDECKDVPDITLIEYLTSMLANEFHDVFLEHPYTSGSRPAFEKKLKVANQIGLVSNLLVDCYHSSTCPFSMRLHYVDLRSKALKNVRFLLESLCKDLTNGNIPSIGKFTDI